MTECSGCWRVYCSPQCRELDLEAHAPFCGKDWTSARDQLEFMISQRQVDTLATKLVDETVEAARAQDARRVRLRKKRREKAKRTKIRKRQASAEAQAGGGGGPQDHALADHGQEAEAEAEAQTHALAEAAGGGPQAHAVAEEEEEEDVCGICLGGFHDNIPLFPLPCCPKFFHVACKDWVMEACRQGTIPFNCPMCRRTMMEN